MLPAFTKSHLHTEYLGSTYSSWLIFRDKAVHTEVPPHSEMGGLSVSCHSLPCCASGEVKRLSIV